MWRSRGKAFQLAETANAGHGRVTLRLSKKASGRTCRGLEGHGENLDLNSVRQGAMGVSEQKRGRTSFCLLHGEWTLGDKGRSSELREEHTAVVRVDDEGAWDQVGTVRVGEVVRFWYILKVESPHYLLMD